MRGVAGGDALAPHPRQRAPGLFAQGGLEGGHERWVDRPLVALERRPPDERPPAQEDLPPPRGPPPAEKEPPLQGSPASQAVEKARLLQERAARRHQPRRLQRILGVE